MTFACVDHTRLQRHAKLLPVGVSVWGGTLLASHVRALRLPQSSRIRAECMKVAVDRAMPEEAWSCDDVDLEAMACMLEHGVRGHAASVGHTHTFLTTRASGEVEAHGLA